jgi:CRP-like cAMP-binding protein
MGGHAWSGAAPRGRIGAADDSWHPAVSTARRMLIVSPRDRLGAPSNGALTVPRDRSNALLAGMPRAARACLAGLLSPVSLSSGEVLHEPDTLRHVYFPVDCVVSLFAPIAHHLSIEVALVGSEGMVGVALALGVRTSPLQALVQGSGRALRMEASAFRRELRRSGGLRAGVYRYVDLLMGQLGQNAACNAFHPLESRCARWLLMTRDRMHSDELELTHEFLARMLGVRRVGVTVAAGNLQRRGLIAYARGRITILDAERLEQSACECYAVLQKLYAEASV